MLFHIAVLHIIATTPYFLASEIITPAQHKSIEAKLESLVRELSPQALHIIDAWGLPAQVIRDTPAASFGSERGWDGFNERDNQGEVFTKARL